jgi:3-oxoacyl-[acyl-carrier-protein] synthase-3
MGVEIGILSAAVELPEQFFPIEQVFEQEQVPYGADTAARLGMETIAAGCDRSGSELAFAASQKALVRAGVEPTEVDVILDFSALPQEYLVPAWSMSNRLQHELGATKAYSLGMSSGGSSNFQVGLHTADALLRSDEAVQTVLMVAADSAIQGHRILHPEQAVSVFADAAAALLLRADAGGIRLLGTEISTDPSYRDVCFVPGGAIAQPDRLDLYRMVLDHGRFAQADLLTPILSLRDRLAETCAVRAADLACGIYPNLSARDQGNFQRSDLPEPAAACLSNRQKLGHLYACDLVQNFLTAQEDQQARAGDRVLLASHGMGYHAAVSLLQF